MLLQRAYFAAPLPADLLLPSPFKSVPPPRRFVVWKDFPVPLSGRISSFRCGKRSPGFLSGTFSGAFLGCRMHGGRDVSSLLIPIFPRNNRCLVVAGRAGGGVDGRSWRGSRSASPPCCGRNCYLACS